MFGLEIMICTK